MVKSKQDSTITITLNKNDAYLLRRYIVDLEYKSVNFDILSDKLTLMENKSIIWEQTANNYKEEKKLAALTLKNQITLQNSINQQIKDDLKNSNRQGVKKGALIGATAAVIICLLIR